MKKLSFVNKVIFFINNIFAISLLLFYVIPYIKPSSFQLGPVIGLVTPAFIVINIIFLLYWIFIGFKRQFLLSAFVLLIGYFVAPPIYKFSSKPYIKKENELTIMTYNVRKFNMYKWIKDENIPQKISKFIQTEDPDVITFQEYKKDKKFILKYPYLHIHRSYNWNKAFSYSSGLAFYSKYPIIDTGAVKYKSVFTSIAYIDILRKKDTIRIYNMHLESLGVNPDKDYFGHKNSGGLIKRLGESFKVQQTEVDTLNYSLKNSKLKFVLTGDMNNTAYSWSYKNLKENLKDTYLEAGKGFGKTFSFKGFPLRIDYIFTNDKFEILQHKNYNVKYSDHYPILTTVSF